MQDRDFEKQVQEKMEGLRFSPSESVWAGVERGIRKEGRRYDPLFWLFMALGIALTGSLYWMFLPDHGQHPIARTGINSTRPATGSQASGGDSGLKNTVRENEQTARSSARSDISREGDKEMQKPGQVRTVPGSAPSGGIPADMPWSTRSQIPQKSWPASPADLPSPSGRIGEFEEPASGMGKAPLQLSLANAAAKSNVLTGKEPGPSGLRNKTSGAAAESGAHSKSISKASTSGKKRWFWGISLSPGISTTYREFFNNTGSGPVGYYTTTPSTPSPVQYYSPSQIRAGFSIDAGAFAERVLNQKFSLKGGLSYHYYSNSIETGAHSDSTVTVYTNSVAPFTRNGFYTNGKVHSYTNQYHFIEIPVSVQYRILQKGKNFLFTDGGFSVARMISSNALHFDYSTGAYYQNNALFNKTQVSATLAIDAGFYHHRALVQVGPELRYGLTNLLSGKTGEHQHLFFTGIRMTYTPAKK